MRKHVGLLLQNIHRHSSLFTLLTLAVILFSIPLTVIVLQTNQDNRQLAAKKKKDKEVDQRKRERGKRIKRAGVPGRILVRFKPQRGTSIQATGGTEERIRKKYKASVERKDNLRLRVIKVKPGQERQVIDELIEDPNVEFVEQSSYVHTMAEPNDPNFSRQWGFSKVGIPTAWDTTEGKDSIVIAVLDTGIDENHPDLKSKIVSGKSKSVVSGGGNSPQDKNGHGTHVAGIAAAATNNDVGIAGVCPQCKIMNVKIMPDSGSNGLDTDFAEGIRYAVDNGANIINMSIAGPDDMPIVNEAIDYAVSKGVLVIAAAGNCGAETKAVCPVINATGYPAAYDKTIAVAATDERDNRAAFSSHGSYVDIAAPGDNILSTMPTYSYELQKQKQGLTTSYAAVGGTSMAAPMVAGIAGLLMSEGLSASQARDVILRSADKISGTGKLWDNGRINAAKAITTQAGPDDGGSDESTPDPCVTPDQENGATNNKKEGKAKSRPTKAPRSKKDKASPTPEESKSDRKASRNSGGTLYERLSENAERLRERLIFGSGGNGAGVGGGRNTKKDRNDKEEDSKEKSKKETKSTKKSNKKDKTSTQSTQIAQKDPCDPESSPRPTRTKNKNKATPTAAPATNRNASISVVDYSMILDCYSDGTRARNCTPAKKARTDLNKDGNVNKIDIQLYLSQTK